MQKLRIKKNTCQGPLHHSQGLHMFNMTMEVPMVQGKTSVTIRINLMYGLLELISALPKIPIPATEPRLSRKETFLDSWKIENYGRSFTFYLLDDKSIKKHNKIHVVKYYNLRQESISWNMHQPHLDKDKHKKVVTKHNSHKIQKQICRGLRMSGLLVHEKDNYLHKCHFKMTKKTNIRLNC